MDTASLQKFAEARYDEFVATLAELVNIDSGSWNAAGVNAVGDRCEQRLRATGWTVERQPHQVAPDGRPLGDVVVARRHGSLPVAEGGQRIVVLAHLDTVFDDGAAAERPFRIDGRRAYGPGVADDKGGLLTGLTAFDVLLEAGWDRYAELTLVCSPDEEIGSPAATPVIRAAAADADVALCLECARPTGEVVSRRKGVVDITVEITGRAAHAGIEPEKGINAALEAAHQTVAIQSLNGRWPDVTVNVGAIQAGSRANIVCPSARLEVDIRSPRAADLAAALAAIDEIVATPRVTGAATAVRRRAEHQPMEQTPSCAALLATAVDVAREIGFELRDTATGGGADANTTAGMGVPTLDGLGPVGGDFHSPAEWLDLDSVVPRVTLLAGLLARLGDRASSGLLRD